MSSLDLNDLLQNWKNEPGAINARKIIGTDGREKVQLRIDLGLLQMEMTGRPDGQQPFGYESVLAYHKEQARQAEKENRHYTFEDQDLMALQQEGVQYYHRYLSLFQLKDFANVIRDTQRNLDLIDFVSEYCNEEEAKWSFTQHRPYVTMMNTRAKASMEIERANTAQAVKIIEEGIKNIESFYEGADQPEWITNNSELAFLKEWLGEVRQHVPETQLESLERNLQEAINEEAYERAAELRDAIRKMSHNDQES